VENMAQDMLSQLDQEKKGASVADEWWHEIEAFVSLACLYSLGESTLDQALQAAKDRIDTLKKNDSIVLEMLEFDISRDEGIAVSLIDVLLFNAANIKDVFDDHIKKGKVSPDKRKIVDLQLGFLQSINEMLGQIGLKQHLSDENILIHYKGVLGAITVQAESYKENVQHEFDIKDL